jgi:hypothetical protein
MLRSGLGAAIALSAKLKRFRLVVSDALRDEVSATMLAACAKSVEVLRKELSFVQSATGTMPHVELPKEHEFASAIRERWTELDQLCDIHTVSHELMRKALNRVNAHRAPAAEKEQFRDALLWEFALEVAESREVHFVTDDSDFRSGDKLRPELAQEAARSKGGLHFCGDAGQLLRRLVPETPSIAVEAVIEKVRSELGRFAGRGMFELFDIGELVDGSSAHPYLTEKLNTLAVDFKVALRASRREDNATGEIVVQGECMMDVDTGYVFDVRPEDIVFATSAGTTKIATFLYADGFGSTPRPVPYNLRRSVTEFIGE